MALEWWSAKSEWMNCEQHWNRVLVMGGAHCCNVVAERVADYRDFFFSFSFVLLLISNMGWLNYVMSSLR